MLKTLMNQGSFRIDYFHPTGRHAGDGVLALYVCGTLDPGNKYSRMVKKHLYGGLLLVKQHLGLHNLFAVYMDVNTPENLKRPAYLQMKDDLRSGFFRRVFVSRIGDLIGSSETRGDWERLNQEIGGIELITYDHETCQILRHEVPQAHWVENIQCFTGCVCGQSGLNNVV